MYLIAFPLLLIPFVLYNMVAFLLNLEFGATIVTLRLLSGVSMAVSTGDMLVLLAVLLLYVEVLKATRLSSKAVMDHVLSLILFVAMVAEFVMVPRAATPAFLTLIALSFVDVIGGLTISIRAAHHELAVEHEQLPTHG